MTTYRVIGREGKTVRELGQNPIKVELDLGERISMRSTVWGKDFRDLGYSTRLMSKHLSEGTATANSVHEPIRWTITVTGYDLQTVKEVHDMLAVEIGAMRTSSLGCRATR